MIPRVVLFENDVYLCDLDFTVYKAPHSEIEIKYDPYGHARICQNGKYGFINKRGEIVIPCQFYYATSFSNNYKGVKWYDASIAEFYIDKEAYDQQKPNILMKKKVDNWEKIIMAEKFEIKDNDAH